MRKEKDKRVPSQIENESVIQNRIEIKAMSLRPTHRLIEMG